MHAYPYFIKVLNNYFIIVDHMLGKETYQNPLGMNILIQPIHSIQISRGKLYRSRAYPKKQTKQLVNPELKLFASPNFCQKSQKNERLVLRQKGAKHYRRHSQLFSRDLNSKNSARTNPSIPSSSEIVKSFSKERPKSMVIQIRGNKNKVLKQRLSDIFSFSDSHSQYFNRNRFSERKVKFGRSFSNQSKDVQKVRFSKSQLFRIPN